MTNFEVWKKNLAVEQFMLFVKKHLYYMDCEMCPANHTSYCLAECQHDEDMILECEKWIKGWANAEVKPSE